MPDNDKDKGTSPVVIAVSSIIAIVFIIVCIYLLYKYADIDFLSFDFLL
jgi:hypothetical protein